MTTTTLTTQQSHPWRAAVRTAVQVMVAIPGVLLVVAAVLVVIGESDVLPPAWAAWAAAAAVTVSGTAGLLARIMAVPGVDGWLSRLRLSSSPDDAGPDASALTSSYTRGWLARDEQDPRRESPSPSRWPATTDRRRHPSARPSSTPTSSTPNESPTTPRSGSAASTRTDREPSKPPRTAGDRPVRLLLPRRPTTARWWGVFRLSTGGPESSARLS